MHIKRYFFLTLNYSTDFYFRQTLCQFPFPQNAPLTDETDKMTEQTKINISPLVFAMLKPKREKGG